MLKRVAVVGSSTVVLAGLMTGALSAAALAAPCGTGTYSGGGEGTSASPYLLSIAADVTEVKNTAGDWSCVFTLTGDISMGGATWSGASGETIGTSATKFTGIFDGGGYTISGLTINGGTSYDYMGLFGYTDGATISNLGFSGAVSGDDEVGGLIGQADNTTVTNSSATGSVTGDDDYVGGLIGEAVGSTITNSWAEGAVVSNGTNGDEVGGLIGYASTSTTVTGSWATGSATANSGSDSNDVGGLIGQADDTTITDSWASGSVIASDNRAGGLVGYTDNSVITNSWATGSVDGDGDVGGLVGLANGNITGSYATGAVEGSGDDVGGLIGEMSTATAISGSWATGSAETSADYAAGLVAEANAGTISNSWASGTATVTGDDGYAGGLVASSEGTISRSFATGSVVGTYNSGTGVGGDYIGGLVGELDGGTIDNSYATGGATGDNYVGGLVGYSLSSASVENSYSIGVVTARTNVGGLVGSSSSSTASSSYWDTETSGQFSSDGGTGKTTSEMKSIGTFTGWSIVEGYDSAYTWGICGLTNSGYPYLTAFHSSSPCVGPPASFEFTFWLPDGRECTSISPVTVTDGAVVVLPGVNAECQTMPGSTVAGWIIPVAEGYTGAGSSTLPFQPGHKVAVVNSQQFTVVPFEPVLTIELDSNVAEGDSCTPADVLYVSDDNRIEYSWVPRDDISMARLPMQAACIPEGHSLAGWNTAADGSGETFSPGAALPEAWGADGRNTHHLFAMWSAA